MTQIYGDYTTLQEARAVWQGTTATPEDTLLGQLITSTSREIDLLANRKFYPRIETRTYDVNGIWQIDFDDDLLELTTLSNPSGTTIASTNYTLLPYNSYPKYAARLLLSTTVNFVPNASGFYERAVTALGIWGFHPDYDAAWLDTTAVNAAAITTTTATTFTCATGLLFKGYLIQLDSEWMYISAVTVGATDTITVVRGVNGSTAATHVISTPIYRWFTPVIEMLARIAAVAYVKLKNNPVGETVRIGGETFSTPKDVTVYLEQKLKRLGLIRFVNLTA